MSEEPPSRNISIAVVVEDPKWRDFLPDAEAIASRAARAALDFTRAHPLAAAAGGPAGAELALVLADDRQVRALNHRFRGIDKATNVLSFAGLDDADLPDGDTQPYLLGDVVLARETIGREAQAQGKSPADHLTHLVVHGLLHLFGFDHQEEADAAAMEGLEVRVLAQLGVPDPYAIGGMLGAPSQEAVP